MSRWPVRAFAIIMGVSLAVSACTDDAAVTTTSRPRPSTTVVPGSGPTQSVTSSLVPCDAAFATERSTEPNALASEKVRADLIDDDGVVGYTVSVHDEDGWSMLATVDPLVRLAYSSPSIGPTDLSIEPAEVEIGADSAVLTSTTVDVDGATWTVRVELAFVGSPCVLEVTSSVSVDQDRALLYFSSPMLDVGRGSFGTDKDTAVLGGLDWTAAGEESQASAFTPDPLDVAWPMMALAHQDHLIGVMWDPLQTWDGSHQMPQPIFASPDWIGRAESHVFGLGVPTAPDWIAESLLVDERDLTEKTAAAQPLIERVVTPYLLTAGQELRVEAAIVADYPAEIPEAVQIYVERFGLPEQPGFDVDAGVEAVVDAYLETAWDPATRSWHQGTFGPKAPYITAVTQLAAYADTAEPGRAAAAEERITEALGPEWQTRHDSGPSSAHMDFLDYGFRTGDTEEVLNWSAGSSSFARSSQRDDGSWGYVDDGSICEGALGEPGTNLLGTNVINASIILEHARITREDDSVSAGMAALENMDRFVKPAGAQTGEVPLIHGDPWAVAWAVRAYVEGYRISGDPHHLDKAREWAFKGIPFMYTWSLPDRPVMAYSVIGVMGTSCWTGSWAGVAVQWVGLDYAASLLELATVDDTFPWRDIAEGIGQAAIGMFDDRPPPEVGQWTEVSLTTTAPANATGLGFSVRVNQELTLAGPTEFLVDDVSLVDLVTGEDQIANGSFDSGELNEYPWYWEGGTVDHVAGDQCRSGGCVHVVATGEQTVSAGADIRTPAVPGRSYRLSLWVALADDPPPSSGPLFRVEYFLEHDEAKWVSIFARPLTGLLPDFYDIDDQTGFAPILPERVGDVLLGLGEGGLHVKTETVRDDGRELVISGLADIVDAHIGEEGELVFEVRPRTADTTHLLVVTDQAPSRVSVDGTEIDTWRWDPATGFLFIAFEHDDSEPRTLVIG
ncbi:MAG: hypothetical protein WBZ45_13330 [Acidimicrobiia bacterium]